MVPSFPGNGAFWRLFDTAPRSGFGCLSSQSPAPRGNRDPCKFHRQNEREVRSFSVRRYGGADTGDRSSSFKFSSTHGKNRAHSNAAERRNRFAASACEGVRFPAPDARFAQSRDRGYGSSFAIAKKPGR